MPGEEELDQLLDDSSESDDPNDEETDEDEEQLEDEQVEPEPEPEAAVEDTPVVARQEYTSPYAAGRLTTEEQDLLNERVDPDVQRLIHKIADSAAQQAVQADRQARSVAQNTGLTQEFMAEYDIDKYMPYVDPSLKGTRQGVIIATQLAIGARVAEGADYSEELEKAARLMKGNKQVTPPAAPAPRQPVKPLAPAAVVSRGSVNGVGGPASQQRSGRTRAQARMDSFIAKVVN